MAHFTLGNYFDELGLPVTKTGDGGDSAAEWGTLVALAPKAEVANLGHLYIENPSPVRHPDKSKWYGLPWRFSRDQLIPFICALIMSERRGVSMVNGTGKVGDKLFEMHRKRKFLTAWNLYRNHVYPTPEEHYLKSTPDVRWDMKPKQPDFCGPEVWALWLRYRLESREQSIIVDGLKWLLLNILDIETLIGSLLWFFRKDRVTRNHLLVTIVSIRSWPTLTSFLNYAICPKQDLINRWEQHCEATGAIDTAELFRLEFKR